MECLVSNEKYNKYLRTILKSGCIARFLAGKIGHKIKYEGKYMFVFNEAYICANICYVCFLSS